MKDFIPYELAKILEAKGFDNDFNYGYNDKGDICVPVYNIDEDQLMTMTPCPDIHEVLKWLREEKKIFIEIALSPDGYQHIIYTGLYCMATSCAYHFTFDGFYRIEDNYITYEQAAIAGIEYVVNNLI